MSIKSSAYHSISVANNQLGGAYSSKSARTRHGREFLDYCHFNGRSLTDIKQTTFDLLKDLESALAALRRGGVIAYPTEAVWGLGCDPRNEEAVLKLLALKRFQRVKWDLFML